MKIVLDARWIFDELTGIGTYTQEMIRYLAEHDRENEYVLLFRHERVLERTAEATRFNTAPNVTPLLLPMGPFDLRNQVLLPNTLARLRADVFHTTNYMMPLLAFPRGRAGRPRCVVTIHDLIPLRYPDHAPQSRKSRFFPVFKWIMRQVGRRADIITTVSEASRRDIIDHLRIEPARHDRVVVIPNGVGSQYQPGPPIPPGPRHRVLYVGRLDPYKNVTVLVEALARLRRSVPEASLRIIGPRDPRYPEAARRTRELDLEAAVEWCGYLSGPDLVEAYQRSHVLALPSRCEGFGLPVVEAMACGTPVVCGNASSLPEVAGDAALLVDPDDPDALADALGRVLTDAALADSMRSKGLEQAGRFTWENAARRLLEAYRQAVLLEPAIA